MLKIVFFMLFCLESPRALSDHSKVCLIQRACHVPQVGVRPAAELGVVGAEAETYEFKSWSRVGSIADLTSDLLFTLV